MMLDWLRRRRARALADAEAPQLDRQREQADRQTERLAATEQRQIQQARELDEVRRRIEAMRGEMRLIQRRPGP